MIKLPFITSVKGVSFYQNAVESVNIKDDCIIVHEKNNPFDENACAVKVKDAKLGYVPKILAEQLVEHGDRFSGTVVDIVGQSGMRGIRIKIKSVDALSVDTLETEEKSYQKKRDSDLSSEMKVFSKSGRFLGFLMSDASADSVDIKDSDGEIFSFPSELITTSR